MGNVECLSPNQVTINQPEIIQKVEVVQKEIPKELLLVKQFYAQHPTISRILNGAQIKQQQQAIINKEVFLSHAISKQLNDGTIIMREDFKGNKRNGFGIMICKENSYYEGLWLNDMKQGKGVLATESGEYYYGDWSNDVPSGFGVYCTLSPYYYYKGQWNQGVKHGQGTEHLQDGSKYVGRFVYGEKSGKGKQVYSNKTEYEGEFKNGMPDGFGKFRGKEQIYEGNWENGKMHGPGCSQWLNSRNQVIGSYCGEYKDGVKDGYGQYTDSKGTVYKGMWINGQMNENAPIDIEKKM